MKMSQVEWWPVTKAVAKEYSKDDVPGLAAELAYWIIFSIFPFFIFLATLAGLIGQAIGIGNIMQNITDNLYSALDRNTAETLRGVLETILTPAGGALSIGAIVSAVLALNSASTAVSTMMKAFNRAYGVQETRNFIIAKLTALGLTLTLVILLIGGSILLTAGGGLARIFNLGTVGTVILLILRIAGAIAGISLGLAILYWKGPNVKQQFNWISPGALLATVAILIFSALFGLYVSFFAGASFNKTYGTIAGAIIFLFFLRIVSMLVLVGAEFNAEAARRYDPETIRDKVTDPAKQLPGKQPAPHPQAAREAGVTQGQVAATNTASAQKLANGGGGPESASEGRRAAGATGVGGFNYDEAPEAPSNEPSLDERLRAIRERPYRSALAEVQRAEGLTSPEDQERRAKTALATLGVAAVTAVGAVVTGATRGRAA
jgi:membrane protein